jgi:sulfate transport system permease protein
VKWALRIFVILYVGLLVIWPVYLVGQRTFEGGWSGIVTALTSPEVLHGLRLTLVATFWSVLFNLVFGVGISLLLVRKEFRGKGVLSVLLDLPMSVSPVVVGLALMLVYAPDTVVGRFLYGAGYQIIFATPGIVLATTFVALPLVIREVVPVLQEIGDDQEVAAQSLGATPWQSFWRVTLPGIKWAVIYGVVLTLARSLGEFGAVKVVSGNVSLQTQTATLVVQDTYQNFQPETAYTLSLVLIILAIACITVVSILRPRKARKAA